jgi:hypothetical protein
MKSHSSILNKVVGILLAAVLCWVSWYFKEYTHYVMIGIFAIAGIQNIWK